MNVELLQPETFLPLVKQIKGKSGMVIPLAYGTLSYVDYSGLITLILLNT